MNCAYKSRATSLPRERNFNFASGLNMGHSNQPQIVVLGAMNSDFLIKGKRFPRPGETLEGDTFLAANGGKGANQAVAAARLGAASALISCVGDDERGKEMRGEL